MSYIVHTPQGAYAFYRRANLPRLALAKAETFADTPHIESFLIGISATPASRAALHNTYCDLFGAGTAGTSQEEMIRRLGTKIRDGEIIVNNLTKACGRPPGKDAIERPPAPSPPKPAGLRPPPAIRASKIVNKSPAKITEYKIAVEVAGRDLRGSMGDDIAASAVKTPGGQDRRSPKIQTGDHRPTGRPQT